MNKMEEKRESNKINNDVATGIWVRPLHTQSQTYCTYCSNFLRYLGRIHSSTVSVLPSSHVSHTPPTWPRKLERELPRQSHTA